MAEDAGERSVWGLLDAAGHRKYLTDAERRAFMAVARGFAPEVLTFCWLLKETGCRLSEALELTPDHIDRAAGVVVFRSLKKRRPGVFRAVPVSQGLLTKLAATHDLEDRHTRLWPWHRMTGHRRIKEVMAAAGISGPHATAKGLRHGFGVVALERGVPLNLLQKWLGHAKISTTAIYGDAVGSEERRFARKMWA